MSILYSKVSPHNSPQVDGSICSFVWNAGRYVFHISCLFMAQVDTLWILLLSLSKCQLSVVNYIPKLRTYHGKLYFLQWTEPCWVQWILICTGSSTGHLGTYSTEHNTTILLWDRNTYILLPTYRKNDCCMFGVYASTWIWRVGIFWATRDRLHVCYRVQADPRGRVMLPVSFGFFEHSAWAEELNLI